MSHSHSHDHSHGHGHSHAPSSSALAGDAKARRALWVALLIGVAVLTAELIAGFVFGSLALLGDAAHMLTDVGAYAIALWAAHIASKPVSASATFGSGRVEILAALVNGATLLAASAWIVIEAVRRMIERLKIVAFCRCQLICGTFTILLVFSFGFFYGILVTDTTCTFKHTLAITLCEVVEFSNPVFHVGGLTTNGTKFS